VIEVGAKPQVIPGGAPAHERATAELKVFSDVAVSVVGAEAPFEIVRLPLDSESAKSGAKLSKEIQVPQFRESPKARFLAHAP
jgi:hypothetical protein